MHPHTVRVQHLKGHTTGAVQHPFPGYLVASLFVGVLGYRYSGVFFWGEATTSELKWRVFVKDLKHPSKPDKNPRLGNVPILSWFKKCTVNQIIF